MEIPLLVFVNMGTEVYPVIRQMFRDLIANAVPFFYYYILFVCRLSSATSVKPYGKFHSFTGKTLPTSFYCLVDKEKMGKLKVLDKDFTPVFLVEISQISIATIVGK